MAQACLGDCPLPVDNAAPATIADEPAERGGFTDIGTPAPAAAPLDAALAAAGESVFRKCQTCHQVGDGAQNRTGPVLNGVYGALAGSNPDFDRYSGGMVTARGNGFVWNAANLDAFLTRPRDVIAGTRMSFAGLRSAEDRAAVIEYLRSFTADD